MLLFPKPKKKPKRPRKPLPRSKKRIAARTKFVEWGKNSCKAYRRKFTDDEVTAKAVECRRERLANATEAEDEMARILANLGLVFVREKIIVNGDRWVLLDFFIPSHMLVIELDGDQHRFQKEYDQGRSMWLARKHRLKTVRFWNNQVMNGQAEQRLRQMLGFDTIPKCNSA